MHLVLQSVFLPCVMMLMMCSLLFESVFRHRAHTSLNACLGTASCTHCWHTLWQAPWQKHVWTSSCHPATWGSRLEAKTGRAECLSLSLPVCPLVLVSSVRAPCATDRWGLLREIRTYYAFPPAGAEGVTNPRGPVRTVPPGPGIYDVRGSILKEVTGLTSTRCRARS